MHELRKAARPIIAIATGGIALWITKDAVADLYTNREAARAVLEMTARQCTDKYSTWQLVTLMSSIGAIAIGMLGWWLAPSVGLTDDRPRR